MVGADAVDQGIQAPVGMFDPPDEFGRRAGVGDVGAHAGVPGAQGLEFGAQGGRFPLALAVADGDAPPFRSQGKRQRTADARTPR